MKKDNQNKDFVHKGYTDSIENFEKGQYGFEKIKYAGDTEDALVVEKSKTDARANENRKKSETEGLAE